VGGELIKGISGGERKRTSVGVELVTKPALVFLDEPTSGLDSYSAVQLCQVLKKVANAGSSVLFTIHQPSSEIFNSFDRLILMNKGRVMFQGPVGEVPDYFSDHGFPSPPNYNPADWVMVSKVRYGVVIFYVRISCRSGMILSS
jgi:ABC-type multidrug transport system ATPase subunit